MPGVWAEDLCCLNIKDWPSTKEHNSKGKKNDRCRPDDENSRCPICLNKFKNRSVVERDHIVPFSYSHDNSEENMQWLCGSCNNWKGTRVQGLRKLDGRAFYVQRRLGNLQSMFSLDVYDRLVRSSQQFPNFRGKACYVSLAEYDKRVANEDTYFTSIDCSTHVDILLIAGRNSPSSTL